VSFAWVKSRLHSMNPPLRHRKYLVTGASGYVGGRLVRALVD